MAVNEEFLALDLIYLFGSHDTDGIRLRFNFVAVRRVKKSKEKYIRCIELAKDIRQFHLLFGTPDCGAASGLINFSSLVPRHTVPILESAGINELPIFAALAPSASI